MDSRALATSTMRRFWFMTIYAKDIEAMRTGHDLESRQRARIPAIFLTSEASC
jgi:hypothetical protein